MSAKEIKDDYLKNAYSLDVTIEEKLKAAKLLEVEIENMRDVDGIEK